MTEPRTQRRLAAILAADVVGFSRLMQLDEAGTLAALKARWRDVLSPGVARHHGRVVKVIGDGVLVEFASAVDAVECAVALQAGFATANDGLSEDRRVVLRIGINLGDIIVEGTDIYGDGVNVAARLEGISEPGSIYISGSVYDQVRRKLSIAFDDLGQRTVKNLSEPLHVYCVGISSPQTGIAPLAAKTAIAVLPFTNMSDEAGQTYFSDGITEDIITELSRFRDLRVASRNASFRYRDGPREVGRIGRELGVNYLLEGSVRRMGKRIRITAQLTEIQTGSDLWAEKFDRDQEDLFAVQDEVARVIVATLVGRIEDAVVAGARRKPPASLAAYECVLRAAALPLGDKEDEAEARNLLERAVALDPGYALAYASLAISYRAEWALDLAKSTEVLDQALTFARKAVKLDESNGECQLALGMILVDYRDFDLAEYHMRRSISLNPNRPVSIATAGQIYSYIGRPDETLVHFELARSIDPFFEPPWFWRMQGVAHFVARRYDEAIASIKKSSNMPSWIQGYLAASFAKLGRMDQAHQIASEIVRLDPEFTIALAVGKEPFRYEMDRQHLIEAMRSAGLPE